MKKLAVTAIAISLFVCGCGKKNEDYRAHETETFRHEKMETFKKLNEMRSALNSALWEKGEEKTSQQYCRKKLKDAADAVSKAGEMADNFLFACDSLSCKDCKIHLVQTKMILLAKLQCTLLNAKDLPNIYVTDSHREEIEKTITEIENAIKSLEKPEEVLKKLEQDKSNKKN